MSDAISVIQADEDISYSDLYTSRKN
jgi:hypothetical protein